MAAQQVRDPHLLVGTRVQAGAEKHFAKAPVTAPPGMCTHYEMHFAASSYMLVHVRVPGHTH